MYTIYYKLHVILMYFTKINLKYFSKLSAIIHVELFIYLSINFILYIFQDCQTSGGKCEITVDGFYLETVLCTIFGICWYKYFSKTIHHLQSKDLKHWHVDSKKHSQL